MGFFSEQQLPVVVDDENTITIRRLNYGQRQACLSRASKMNPVTQEVSIDFAKLQSDHMVRRVAAWEGPGFENLPVSEENVLKLPTWITDKVQAAADEWDSQLSEEEKK